jgi:spore maturation protein A
MNIVFAILIIASLTKLTFTTPELIMGGMLEGASDALQFAIRLLGIYLIWITVLKIAEATGLDKRLSRMLSCPVKALFGGESDEAHKNIALNLSANMLGMGGAATPLGIKSIELMQEKRNKTLLLVINSGSVTLIPTTIIAMRASAGAQADIILPALITSVLTTIIGIVLVKVFCK